MIANNRNYRDLFYSAVPDGLVAPRAKREIAHTADVCAELAGWRKDDLFSDRLDDICRLVDEIRAEKDASEGLRALLAQLPPEMTIEEAHLFLSARKDDDRVRGLTAMATRLGQPEPDTSLIPERVQVMTMHGAKGLSAKVVFIPGLAPALSTAKMFLAPRHGSRPLLASRSCGERMGSPLSSPQGSWRRPNEWSHRKVKRRQFEHHGLDTAAWGCANCAY